MNENKDGFIIRRSKPLGSKKNPRYIIAEKQSNCIVDDARGYGYKSESSAKRGWNYKNKCKTATERKLFRNQNIKNFLEKFPTLEEELNEDLFISFKLDLKSPTRFLIDQNEILEDIDEIAEGFTLIELIHYLGW